MFIIRTKERRTDMDKLLDKLYEAVMESMLVFGGEEDTKKRMAEALDLDMINLIENNRLLKKGSKQLCGEISRLVKEREILIYSLRYAIGQYKTDYTEEELLELEPRDNAIYNKLVETLNIIDI